jgi:hypothetical protein
MRPGRSSEREGAITIGLLGARLSLANRRVDVSEISA